MHRLALVVFLVGTAAAKESVTKDEVAGGDHWRINSDQGVVHVWKPAGYQAASAGTVVYVHGHMTSADGAWRDHELAKQFKKSRQNALFVVPEAPSGNGETVNFRALGELLKLVRRKTRVRLPDGAVVVVGHSGAYSTIANWLDYRRFDHLILLDAMYGRQEDYKAWLETAKGARSNRLIMVAYDTRKQSDAFVKSLKTAVRREDIPESFSGFSRKERRAKTLYMKSQYGHMAIVTDGKVLPLLLRLTPLRRL